MDTRHTKINPTPELIDKFNSQIKTGWGCWTWLGKPGKNGYCQVQIDGKKWRAHRAVYALVFGEIPDGLILDHKCRNRWCVNPFHLRPCTCKQNILWGNSPAAINSKKVNCKNGHPLKGENLFIDVRGARICKACRKKYDRERSRQRRNQVA